MFYIFFHASLTLQVFVCQATLKQFLCFTFNLIYNLFKSAYLKDLLCFKWFYVLHIFIRPHWENSLKPCSPVKILNNPGRNRSTRSLPEWMIQFLISLNLLTGWNSSMIFEKTASSSYGQFTFLQTRFVDIIMYNILYFSSIFLCLIFAVVIIFSVMSLVAKQIIASLRNRFSLCAINYCR